MSLYSDYLNDRGDLNIIEDARSFATYRVIGDECYIQDIYVSPDLRETGLASKLADQIVEIAKNKNCKYLTGSVNTSIKDPTRSIKVLLAYGFKLLRSEPAIIWFVKNI